RRVAGGMGDPRRARGGRVHARIHAWKARRARAGSGGVGAMDYLAGIMIRTATDRDGGALLDMVSRVYLEYPGCRVDDDSEVPELRAPATTARQVSGRWWIAEFDGDVVGSVAVVPSSGRDIELKKLYVAKTARRGGLGAQLVRLAESEALA